MQRLVKLQIIYRGIRRTVMKEITVAELKEVLGTVSLLDVRERDEYVSGHVASTVHIPLATIPVRMNEIERNATHYLICQAGGRSAQACAFLEQQGYDVVNVLGGTGTWIDSGFPIEVGE